MCNIVWNIDIIQFIIVLIDIDLYYILSGSSIIQKGRSQTNVYLE